MKRLLLGVLTVGAVGGVALLATNAFFSDTETSTGNILQAGAIDLLIDNTSYRTDPDTGLLVASAETSWTLTDLTIEKFFNFLDLKPGDVGEDTISLHVNDNDAWACANVQFTENSDNGITEPEDEAGSPSADLSDGTPNGDLAEELNFAFWADDGNNVLETDEEILVQGPASNVLDGDTLALAQPVAAGPALFGNTPMTGAQDYFVGKYYCYGALTPAPVAPSVGGTPLTLGTGFTCDGSQVTNLSQTDRLVADISFYATQSRNNPDFDCDDVAFPTPVPSPTPTPTVTPSPLPE